MARDLFAALTERPAARTSARWYTLPLSILTHTLGLLAVVAVPLVANGMLPTPATVLIFAAIPAPPAAVPPPPLAREPLPEVTEPEVDVNRAPIAAPEGVRDEAPPVMPQRLTVSSPTAMPATTGVVRELVGPPPAPLPPELPRVGGNIKEPAKIRHVAPTYPPIARAARVEGTVIIEATIGRDGAVTDARVLRSVSLLDLAALSAVLQWRYTPPLLNGEPIDVLMTVTVRFGLQ